MATLAADDRQGNEGADQVPISAHPAFPAIVALWFAALLGLGSLILPGVLLERLSGATGIAAIVPAAAPPLGFTARATVALGAALVGAVLGLLLARRVAGSRTPPARLRAGTDDPRRCRPISAHDELGEEGIASGELPGGAVKRRTLAMAEDASASEYLQAAPLPGRDSRAAGEQDEASDDALELTETAEQDGAQEAHGQQDFTMTDQPEFDPFSTDSAEGGERQDFAHPSLSGAGFQHGLDPAAEANAGFHDDRRPPEALEFSPPSLRRAAPPEASDAMDESAAEEPAATFDRPPAGAPVPQAFEPAPEPALRLAAVETGQDDEQRPEPAGHDLPFEELGLVQLATRLGDAIERRRAHRAALAEARPAPRPAFAAAEDFGPAEAEDAARARADFFGGRQPGGQDTAEAAVQSASASAAHGSAPQAPAAMTGSPLRDIDFGDDGDDGEDEDLSAAFSLPLRGLRNEPVGGREDPPSAPWAADGEDCEDDSAEDDEYSSLLAMKGPFRRNDEFVRVDEPEPDEIEATVTFPEREAVEAPVAADPAERLFDPPAGVRADQARPTPRNPGDAERELRAALDTLQRMSGAA